MKSYYLIQLIILHSICHYSESPPKKSRTHKTYITQSYCKTVKTAVDISLPGCLKKTIITIGCTGRCNSESGYMIYRQKMINKCSCCKPTHEFKFVVLLHCPGLRTDGNFKFITMLAARKCSCQPCSNYIQENY